MWAAAGPPVPAYSADRVARRKAAKNNSTTPSASASSSPSSFPTLPSPPQPPSPPASVAPVLTHTNNIADFLEPAIEGPPSPASIRALSKQMRRASVLDKHQSHQTSSSGSSSLRSLASADRPSWEHALEGISLSRKSSGRSTASNMQPRERPESVQIFGKSIFNRRGKFNRRESTAAQSSSGSSQYSGELTLEAGPPPTSAPSRDSTTPLIGSFFNRRRTLKSAAAAEESEARRRFQISGPYNFQHLTHTQRDHVPNLQRGSRIALQSDLSAARASQAPSDGSLRGFQAQNLHFADFSSEALPLIEDEDGYNEQPQSRLGMMRPPPLRQHSSPAGRLLHHTRSQEQLRIPPPRPPRSPIEPVAPAAPVPPPRVSSRVSIQHDDDVDPLGSTSLERPQTMGGFRQPTPLGLPNGGDGPGSLAAHHAHSFSADLSTPADHRASRVLPPLPDDANWPLTCPPTGSFDSTLPDVPEEEEHLYMARKSRASVISNNSSLRGSQSVPLLRQFAQSQGSSSQRPPSGASDTLGRFDLFAAQRALRAALNEEDGDCLPRESWEDDIDYCYEHEAEADCEYAWDRPSLDVSRGGEDGDDTRPAEVETGGSNRNTGGGLSPAMLTPGRFDVPALSPASQTSVTSASEAITPTAPAMPRPTLSALKVEEGQPKQQQQQQRQQPQFLHVRTASGASSFKESHGFTLSPSLLIPGSDYHREMMAHEGRGVGDDDDDDEYHRRDEFPRYQEPTLTMETSTLLIQSRTSASTTGSNDSDNSGSERHISTASASTDLTRLTMSTTASIEDLIPKDEPTPVAVAAVGPSFPDLEPSHIRVKSEPMAVLLEGISSTGPVAARRAEFARNHSDTGLVMRKLQDDSSAAAAGKQPVVPKRKEPAQFRNRQRARTTSLSTPPPPGQYALFPSIHTNSSRF